MFQERAKALGCLCAGFVSSGISCSLYVSCGLGSDAFNVMTQGLSDTLGIQTGNAFYVIQGAMLLLVLVLRREIGFGTLFGTFLIGLIMNLWSALLTPLLASAGVGVRLCCAAAAPAFTGLGISLVKKSGFGLTPCDILTLIFHSWLPRMQFRTVRMLYDGAMFLAGVLLGGTIGVGTVFSVLLTGPCIQTASALLDRTGAGQAHSPVMPGARFPLLTRLPLNRDGGR